MSGPIKNSSYGDTSSQSIANSLLEAWTSGLLSASVPWRMISAMTISSLLNVCPRCWDMQPSKIPSLNIVFQRLNSTVSRRIWAERAALPVCSRYLQSLLELQSSVDSFPSFEIFLSNKISVDAATPWPLNFSQIGPVPDNIPTWQTWEANEGWVCSDKSWEIWTGTVEYFAVEWSPPSRSAVRSLMDGGEGPPMLREGCTVLRGLDWDEDGSGTITGYEDGKQGYEMDKAEREKAKKEREESGAGPASPPQGRADEEVDALDTPVPEESDTKDQDTEAPLESPASESLSKKKKKKIPLPKLPVGRVISIEAWKGIPGVARRVRWDLTGEESIYRYGGDGGRYDIVHVEVNEKATRVVKRHPHSETSEQCAVRHGFGARRIHNVLLRLRKSETKSEMLNGETEYACEGIMEWPDFGAGVAVTCGFHKDGTVTVTEGALLYGSKDSGWEARFGQPCFVPGTTIVLSATSVVSSPSLKEDGILEVAATTYSQYEELVGNTSFAVKSLRNRANGEKVRVASELRFIRGKSARMGSEIECSSILPPISFDKDWHAPSLSISRDCRSVTCSSAEGRSTAFLSAGFSKGVHYWEVKIEQADVGSVYIGVAEKPKSSSTAGGTAFDSRPRLNRWLGRGFVNFRATYNDGSERVYGSHCHAGDTVGVLLDCDAGRISFFFDGVKYGEHILNDLGCAFENVSPFGFNADGCGGGGAGQGAPSGEGGRGGRYPANGSVRPKAVWPVIGLRHPGDRVTISRKWVTNYGVDGPTMLRNAMLVDEVLKCYDNPDMSSEATVTARDTARDALSELPEWIIKESFLELKRWEEGKWTRTVTRASGPMNLSSSGLNIDVDTTPLACAAACASIGLNFVLLAGDRVSIKRSAGRILELPEEAEVVGAFQGRLWYKIISQKSEGGSLIEGGGRAWFWDESEVVDGGLQLVRSSAANELNLPLLDRFKCAAKGGLRITYSSGAVIRSDIEILEHFSENVGVIPGETVIPCEDVLERRVNSCGVVRFLVKYEPVGTGWISSRIRGGSEDSILELLDSDISEEKSNDSFTCPYECARSWLGEYNKSFAAEVKEKSESKECWMIESYAEFKELLSAGVIRGLQPLQSDSILCQIVTSISDCSPVGSALDCSYEFLCPALFHALKAHDCLHRNDQHVDYFRTSSTAHQAAASQIAGVSRPFPPMKALLARISMLRAFNRRAKYAIPLYSIRPPQEDSAIVGGLAGFGASAERLGKSRKSDSLRTVSRTNVHSLSGFTLFFLTRLS